MEFQRTTEGGFSLVELSFVLIIVGLLLSVGVGVMNSLTKSGKMAKEKSNIEIIKNSLVSYALSHGRLPCPDTNATPDGNENCPTSNCGTPPCGLPYIDLSTGSMNKDTFSLPYGYDVTDILTRTDSTSICVTLYELNNLYDWYSSAGAFTATCGNSDLVCVTDTADADNGTIAAADQGYYLAAYICSGGEDLQLGGKNRKDGRREYEMASNAYDVTVGRDDIVGELSFADISGKLCTAGNTGLAVAVTNGEVWLDSSGGCAPGTGLTGTITVLLGQTLYYPSACGPTLGDSFEQLARCDLNPGLYAGPNSCVNGTPSDGKLSVNAGSTTITQ